MERETPGATSSNHAPMDADLSLEGLQRVLVGYGVDLSSVDVTEMFSVGNFARMAPRFGLQPGTAYDLRTGWDFDKPEDVKRCWATLEEEDPYLVIGSPLCYPFSVLQNLSAGKRNAEQEAKAKELYDKAVRHLQFMAEVYAWQVGRGKKFLHEHPWSSKSWRMEMMVSVATLPGVEVRRGHQCVHGLRDVDDHGREGPVKKETGWMSNCTEILDAVALLCPNGDLVARGKKPAHEHVLLIGGGRARRAERYPPGLIAAVLRGLRNHLRRVRGKYNIGAMDTGPTAEEPEVDDQIRDWIDENGSVTSAGASHGSADDDDPGAIDEVTGLPLPAGAVREARREEVEYMESKLHVWDVVPVDQCWAETGKPPIGTRWTELNKGDAEHMLVRSRLVAQETKRRSTIDPSDTAAVFAASPPLEALRLLGSLAMSTDPRDEMVLRFLDISRAHPHCEMKRRMYVRLPKEARGGDDPTKCGLLRMCLYGTRDAGQNFEFKVRAAMTAMGCKQGLYSPCCYTSGERKLSFFHHGDDFVILGPRSQSAWLVQEMSRQFIVKDRGVLGPGASDLREIRVLNRLIRWYPIGSAGGERVEYEADPRHVEILLAQLGLRVGSAKAVVTPGAKDLDILDGKNLTETSGVSPTEFRSAVMRANYLAADRPELQFSAKEAARGMQNPTTTAWEAVKRTARFLLGSPRLVWVWRRQNPRDHFIGLGDSDWAGQQSTRKNTSASAGMLGEHLIFQSGTTQGPIS